MIMFYLLRGVSSPVLVELNGECMNGGNVQCCVFGLWFIKQTIGQFYIELSGEQNCISS